MADWRKYLYLEDDKLLAHCRQEIARGSGPGGQKRNKTSNAIRLVHIPSGIYIRAQEQRSLKNNRTNALFRLRLEIALKLRSKFKPDETLVLSAKNPIVVGTILDALNDHGYVIADAAEAMNITTGKLSKLICSLNELLDEVNRQRSLLGLRPMRT